MSDFTEQEKVQRVQPDSVKLDESFVLREDRDIALQYFELYKHRLQILQPSLKQLARKTWGSNIKICDRILQCQNTKYDEVVIIGTCFKEMKKKPTILDEDDDDKDGNNSNNNNNDQPISSLIGLNVSDTDYLKLEDNVGAIKISGDCLNINRLLTGITVAIRGSINKTNGIFIANDYLLCGLPPIERICAGDNDDNDGDDKYVALVSGLEMSYLDENNKHNSSISMLFDYLSGFLGDNNLSSSICRLIIVGNILNEQLPDEDDCIFYDIKFKKKQELKISTLDNKIKELDLWLSQLSSSMNIDLMPGNNDPTNTLLPQQPFHRCLFPLSSSFNTFNRVTNPYKIDIDNKLFLGSSGQNFQDMMKYSNLNMIECMELSIKSRIMAPTAPDTLSCFPFKNNDPFLINKCPNIYFCGNNDEYKVKYIKHQNQNNNNSKKICLLQIPSFRKTKQIVLVNLNTLKPQTVQFGL